EPEEWRAESARRFGQDDVVSDAQCAEYQRDGVGRRTRYAGRFSAMTLRGQSERRIRKTNSCRSVAAYLRISVQTCHRMNQFTRAIGVVFVAFSGGRRAADRGLH